MHRTSKISDSLQNANLGTYHAGRPVDGLHSAPKNAVVDRHIVAEAESMQCSVWGLHGSACAALSMKTARTCMHDCQKVHQAVVAAGRQPQMLHIHATGPRLFITMLLTHKVEKQNKGVGTACSAS